MHKQLLAIGLALSALSVRAESIERGPQPSPAHDPVAVVQFQLEAMKNVDRPVRDAGMAVVFRFSSPGNQAQTGPLPRFARMLREGYGEMLGHRSATVLPTVQQGDEALQPVELTAADGQVHRYVFLLRRQDEGRYHGCWMTDGVIRPEGETAPALHET